MSLEKEKKTVSLFFRQSQNQRKTDRKKESISLWIGSRARLACAADETKLQYGRALVSSTTQAKPASSGKGSFYNQDDWLWEIEEHEHNSDTSEKQSVEISSLKPF